MKTLKDYAKPNTQWAFYKDESFEPQTPELLATFIVIESELVKDTESELLKYEDGSEERGFGYEWNATILSGGELHKIQCYITPAYEDHIHYGKWDTRPHSQFDDCYLVPFEFIDDWEAEYNVM